MSDETPASAPKRPRTDTSTDEVAQPPVVVEHSPAVGGKTVPARDSAEPVVVAPDAAPVVEKPAERIVYLTTPAVPVKKGNRGVGSLIAVLSAIVFTALLAAITAIVGVASGAPLGFSFLAQAQFYIPVLFYVIGFLLLVLTLNRASWSAYIIGSLVLAVFVYFGTIGLGLLGTGIIQNTQAEAAARFAAGLRNPFIVVSALLAREVSLWFGAAIAARGRKVKARNVEARVAFDRDLVEKKAEHERGSAAAPTAD